MAFAPPLDQTPTFPTMVLGETLVTVEAPKTVKLAKSAPSIGVAQAAEEAQNTPTIAIARTGNDLIRPVWRVLVAFLNAIFVLVSVRS